MFGVIRSGSGSMFRCSCSGILLYSASPCSALPWPDEPALPFHALACMQEEAYNVMSMEPRTVAEAVSERCLRVVQVVGCALCVRVGGHEVTCLGHVAQQRQPGLIT